ncbi:putative N-acetyltransferase GCN5 [Blattamonas nauphoetae]|uniref:N-acetyltransferase GCN5 n=1 Tax=Blattamonas nauphoetae TaxID=2049346 RepID=A0ABQ9YHR3_9EUKA|nr:putative N-acetyltransferase GCN5 [Blattamonas nauphoetae]
MDISKVIVRNEIPEDYEIVEKLTYEAFKDFFIPGRTHVDEHYLVNIMRHVPGFVKELDLVAEYDGKIIGNIMYTKSYVNSPDGTRHEILTFGPLSVHPDYQRKGIGQLLMKHSMDRAREMKFRGISILGHPEYYPRAGFKNSGVFGITDKEGNSPPHMMTIELEDGSLSGISGIFEEDPVFVMKHDDVIEFNKVFFARHGDL